MRVVVTGAAGFIGSHLCRYLGGLGAGVNAVDLGNCDVLDSARLRSVLADVRPEAVYHLAALASVSKSWAAPQQYWETNFLGTASVLDAVRATVPGARVLIMSTASVYDGAAVVGPVDECAKVRPVSPYAASKAATETLAKQHVLAYGMQVLIARPFNVIGPGQAATYLVPTLCRRIMLTQEAALRSLDVGNAEAERDFVDVRDVVVGLELIVRHATPGRIYHLCTGTGTTITALARMLGRLVDAEFGIRANPALQRPGDPRYLVGNPARSYWELGWQARTPLADSLSDVLAETRKAHVCASAADGEPRQAARPA